MYFAVHKDTFSIGQRFLRSAQTLDQLHLPTILTLLRISFADAAIFTAIGPAGDTGAGITVSLPASVW